MAISAAWSISRGVCAGAIALKDELPSPTDSPDAARRKIDRLVKLLVMRTGCTDAEALTWIGRWLKNNGRDALNDVEE